MRAAIFAGWLAVLVSVPGQTRECHVDTSQAREVTFLSDAPIEDFEGTTDRIDGFVYWEGDHLKAGSSYETSEFYFEVALDALETGIDLRDRHMRDNYLHTQEHPYATFSGSLQRAEATSDSTWTVRAGGTLSIHGVDQPLALDCVVAREKRGYEFRTTFDVRLPDFDIEIPSLMFMKINEVIEITLHVHLVTVR